MKIEENPGRKIIDLCNSEVNFELKEEKSIDCSFICKTEIIEERIIFK